MLNIAYVHQVFASGGRFKSCLVVHAMTSWTARSKGRATALCEVCCRVKIYGCCRHWIKRDALVILPQRYSKGWWKNPV